MLKKLIVFTLSVFIFSIVTNFNTFAIVEDIDSKNDWQVYGWGVRSSSEFVGDNITVFFDYQWSEDYNRQTGETNFPSLFNKYKVLQFYLANEDGEPYGSYDHFYEFHFDFTSTSLDNTTGYLEILIYNGNNENDLELINYFDYEIETNKVYPSFEFYFNFTGGLFKVNWGDFNFINNIQLENLDNILTWHLNSAYHPSFRILTGSLQVTNVPFNSSDFYVRFVDQVTYMIEHRQEIVNWKVQVLNIRENGDFPSENIGGNTLTALDTILTNIGFFNASGFMFIYFILLVAINGILIFMKLPMTPVIILNIIITALFMFLNYLPMYATIIMILFYIVALLAINKGGLINE